MAPPRRDTGRWRLRGLLLDGPLQGHGIGRGVPEGERVTLRVEGELGKRFAIYESVGSCPEVPPDDGVGLRFAGYEDEEPEKGRGGVRRTV